MAPLPVAPRPVTADPTTGMSPATPVVVVALDDSQLLQKWRHQEQNETV